MPNIFQGNEITSGDIRYEEQLGYADIHAAVELDYETMAAVSGNATVTVSAQFLCKVI